MRWTLLVAVTLGLVGLGLPGCSSFDPGCATTADCALGTRVTTKLSSAAIGQTRDQVVAVAGTPTYTYTGADGMEILTWRREKSIDNVNLSTSQTSATVFCVEKVTLIGGVVTAYEKEGACKAG